MEIYRWLDVYTSSVQTAQAWGLQSMKVVYAISHGSLWPMKIVQTVCASFLRKMIDVSGDSIILRK